MPVERLCSLWGLRPGFVAVPVDKTFTYVAAFAPYAETLSKVVLT